jgi:cyclophilin family peptidyl-prolyl cis-trans isomerase
MRTIHSLFRRVLPAFALLVAVSASAADNPRVELKTSMGTIVLELDAQAAPKTVANFVQYVNDGFYSGTIFHRVIDGFMIQGGGFTADMEQKQTREPIENEAANGLKNMKGTVAMARTGEPHSASAQFFINVADNDFLNHTAPTPDGWGYAVFGKVVEGMEVVDAIRQTPTEQRGPFEGVPTTPVVIESATVLQAAAPAADAAAAPAAESTAPATEEKPQ